MGKKTRKKNQEEVRKSGQAVQSLLAESTEQLSQMQLNDESRRLLGCLGMPRTVNENTTIMRRLLEMCGTDNTINDDDPYGDGDQRGVGELGQSGESTRQIVRQLWARGGDMEFFIIQKLLSPLAYSCCIGNVADVENILKQTTDLEEREHLLERRETGMRVPPLILTMALSKCLSTVSYHTGVQPHNMNHLGVVKVLLKYGCRPDAKEVTGKTVCHYGSGNFATNNTLAMVDYCANAAKTSSCFGKEVMLKDLQKEEYNGMSVILGGYIADSERRQVILPNGKELAILPKNIFNKSSKCIIDDSINLIDIPDRMGCVCFHEVGMGTREDVAKFLCEKHNASLDISDRCGVSLRAFAYHNTVMPTPVQIIMRQHAMKQTKDKDFHCSNCNKFDKSNLKCSRCKIATYCSPDCQRKHWKEHKKVCKRPSERNWIKLNKPTAAVGPLLNYAGKNPGGDYNKPKGVTFDECFWLKVQVDGESKSLLLYDKTRTCTFTILKNEPGFLELLEKVRAEKGAMGRKCHVEASFDKAGDCKVFPSTATLKNW